MNGASRKSAERGQATVELALLLPLFVAVVLMLAEAGLIVRDQILVVHAAREAARAAAVDGGPTADAAARSAAQRATTLDGAEVTLSGERRAGGYLQSTVRYRVPRRLPFLAPLTSRLVLEGSATMRVEGPP